MSGKKTIAGRVKILVLAILLLAVPLAVWAQYFAIVSDSHVGTGDSRYEATMERLEAEKIEVIFHLGDAINYPGNLRQWKRFWDLTGPGKKVYLAAGNHDIDGARSFRIFSRYFPKPYYSLAEGDTLFLVLNTEIPGEERKVAGEQLAWLRNELARPFRYKFVFLHEPLFPILRLHGLDIYEEERDALHRLFRDKGVSLVVSGHDHTYLKSVRDGIFYVISPRSRLQSGLPINDGEPGYIVGERKGKGYFFTVRDIRGEAKDSFAIKK